jgi:uncharacterized protein (UPF0332 family)
MSFDPREFIDIATELDDDDNESHVRSLINRAYYGAYGYAQLKAKIPCTYDESGHRKLISYLKNIPDNKNAYKAGQTLESLFDKRKDADYHYDICIKKNANTFTIKDAKYVIELIDKSGF